MRSYDLSILLLMSSDVTTPDRAADAFDDVIRRVKAEYLEMPGLTLTVTQAARLWALDITLCTAVLAALEQAQFLVQRRHSTFARAQ